jgi:hypothetical protein
MPAFTLLAEQPAAGKKRQGDLFLHVDDLTKQMPEQLIVPPESCMNYRNIISPSLRASPSSCPSLGTQDLLFERIRQILRPRLMMIVQNECTKLWGHLFVCENEDVK